jgi:hypothetical protein
MWAIEVEAIKRWAKSHISCKGNGNTYEIVVIPYHGETHWNSLMLELSHTFHFDSKIGVHYHLVYDIFIQRIYGALLILQSVHPGVFTFYELVEKLMLIVFMLSHTTFANMRPTWQVWKIKGLMNPRLVFNTNVSFIIYLRLNNYNLNVSMFQKTM